MSTAGSTGMRRPLQAAAAAAADEEEGLPTTPKEFLCPITQELMIDPVFAVDGFSYERVAMERWFSTGKLRSPVTNDLIDARTLTPNQVLRSQITEFKRQLGIDLLHACRTGELNTSNKLYAFAEAGADLDARDGNGESPLLLLIGRGQADLACALVRHGCRVSPTNDAGLAALDACRSAKAHAPQDPDRKACLDELEQLIEDALVAEAHRDKAAEDARRRELETSRRRQEELTNQQEQQQQQQAQEALNNLAMGQATGYFPSLFGLQFQPLSPSPAARPAVGAWESEVKHIKAMDAALKALCVLLVMFVFFLGSD